MRHVNGRAEAEETDNQSATEMLMIRNNDMVMLWILKGQYNGQGACYLHDLQKYGEAERIHIALFTDKLLPTSFSNHQQVRPSVSCDWLSNKYK